jgi:Tfp pilus assembly protein PilO
VKSPKSTFRILLAALLVALLVFILAIGAGWFYVLKMSSEVGVLETEIINMRNESSQLSQLSISFQKVSQQKNVVYGAITKTKDESTFMADLEATAKGNGLTITASTIGSSKTKTAKTGDFSQTINKSEYYELPIRYEVSGQYNSFNKFIADLSNLRRLNNVDDISVRSNNSTGGSVGMVKASFNVIIYAKK